MRDAFRGVMIDDSLYKDIMRILLSAGAFYILFRFFQEVIKFLSFAVHCVLRKFNGAGVANVQNVNKAHEAKHDADD